MNEGLTSNIRANYVHVLERIHEIACRSGRNPAEIRLVTVTKGHPVESVQAVIAAGARRLG